MMLWVVQLLGRWGVFDASGSADEASAKWVRVKNRYPK